MTRRSTRIRGVLAAAVSLSLVAAACGDDDDDARRHRWRRDRGAGCRDDGRRGRDDRGGRRGDHRDRGNRNDRGDGHDGAPDGTEPAGEAFQVPTDNCPPDATEPLADGEPIKIAFVGPQTGPLAAFGVIGQGMKIYFDKINEDQGGVDGHQLELVTKDDAYDPAQSAPAVQEAIEGDQVFASVFQVGTPERGRHPAAVRRRLRAAGARRHRLPELGRPGELPVDHSAASRPTPSSRRSGSSSSRRSSRTPRRSPC